jgi:hypothetical protein
VKGERPNRTAEHKKKTMKTNTNTNRKSGTQSRPEQVSTGNSMTKQQARERIALIGMRRANRELRTEAVLKFLKSQLPQQYEMAEIVGRWIWLDFPKDKYRAATNSLWRLGFHWNQRRCVWQHPCGAFAPCAPHPGDPREKYGSHFPADLQPV